MNLLIVLSLGLTATVLGVILVRKFLQHRRQGEAVFYHLCAKCQSVLRWHQHRTGQRGKCPRCRHIFEMPAEPASERPRVKWSPRRKAGASGRSAARMS